VAGRPTDQIGAFIVVASISLKNIGALPLSAADRERLKALQRKVLDGEVLTEVEQRDMGALLKGKEAAQKVGRKPSIQEEQAGVDVWVADWKRKNRKK
jgi:hypothetical protein